MSGFSNMDFRYFHLTLFRYLAENAEDRKDRLYYKARLMQLEAELEVEAKFNTLINKPLCKN